MMAYSEELVNELTKQIEALKAENKALHRQIEWATGFTARVLMGHNVTGTFIKGYEETYGQDEWINISYVKEIFEIIAQPAILKSKSSSEVNKP